LQSRFVFYLNGGAVSWKKFQARNCSWFHDGGRVHSSFGSCKGGYLDQKVCFWVGCCSLCVQSNGPLLW
jgi:hypothetical protein